MLKTKLYIKFTFLLYVLNKSHINMDILGPDCLDLDNRREIDDYFVVSLSTKCAKHKGIHSE